MLERQKQSLSARLLLLSLVNNNFFIRVSMAGWYAYIPSKGEFDSYEDASAGANYKFSFKKHLLVIQDFIEQSCQ